MKKNFLQQDYYKEPELEIYDVKKSLKSFHNRRFKIAYELVRKYYNDGKILDMACGLCEWNKDKLKITGLDISKGLLEKAKKSGRISEVINCNVLDNKLKKESFDMIICTEILEHLLYPSQFIEEVYRLLKPKGIVICSVPYETWLGLWKPLFAVRCFLEGRIKGKKYYKSGAGHINKFVPRSLIPLFRNRGFIILEIINNLRLNFFVVCQKKDSEK